METWTLVYDSFEPEEERLREALTSTGNGHFCTRGSFSWTEADDVHYPGTYVHGGFNRETTIMAGVPVLNEDLVNLPNWLLLEMRIEGEEAVGADNVELLSYRHELDVRNAVLKRNLRIRDRAGRETTLETRRFVSMVEKHLGAMEWKMTPENWSGKVEIVSALDGRVTNRGVARYQDLEGRHLDPVATHTSSPHVVDTLGRDVIALEARTRQSRIYVAEAARTRAYGEGGQLDVERSLYRMEDYVHEVLAFEVEEKTPVRVEKMVAIYTSRDRAINEPLANAMKAAGRYGTFEESLELHTRAWVNLWDLCDVQVPGNEEVQRLLRIHIYHILSVCSPHTSDLDAGIPARGLNGEAYRGHIFWDELYIYPFLNFRLPKITRGALIYRYRRLGEARATAKESGYEGAMFPWQSGSDGQEETQKVHLNPNSGKWEPDLSHNQRHINAAIYYNIWHYYQATGDLEFLLDNGAEMLLEITRFWASIAHFNPERDRYEIHGVMGPDEFHEKYPGAEEGGLNNNAYTNVMVAWMAETALEVLELLPERRRDALRGEIGLADDEIELWEDMSRKMFVPLHDDGVISQFEGYEDLEELDWDHYREEYGKIQRLDRILKAEGDDPDKYKLAKQADVLMLFFLFPLDELEHIFERLGYEFGPDTLRKNVEYYEPRTTHGSTLSFVVHAHVLAEFDSEASWEMYQTALNSDVGDVQGGTTSEGIHLGVMAGTLDLIQRGYMSSEVRDGVLHLDPKLRDKLEGLSFSMRFRETSIELSLEGDELTVATQADGLARSIKIGVNGAVQELKAGERHTFELARLLDDEGKERVTS
ncbi:MAG: GH65 [uncultured Rubrobacteraceae bacterium]|uniref:GH65 n=1 Tax=uncultured Rubrobacteraceae bacterium TaxID=349277 RepID=A0A6J4R095_9ACTN|nr:MAG: GH65 [uncultured Rubrobacteraceae bacterium]